MHRFSQTHFSSFTSSTWSWAEAWLKGPITTLEFLETNEKIEQNELLNKKSPFETPALIIHQNF